MRNSPFVNSFNESNYVFLVSEYIGPLQKNSIGIRISSQGIIHSCMYIQVKIKKLIQQLTQSPHKARPSS